MGPSRRELLRLGLGAAAGVAVTPRAAHARTSGPNGLRWLAARAYHVPSRYTTEESGYQSLGEDRSGKIYIGTARYGQNAYLVEFDPGTERMRAAIDVMQTIGSRATGFAAQAKIHSHVVAGPSGKLYCGSKQGYPVEGEKRTDYPGGHPLVYDPASGVTRAYPVPIPHQGVISHVPDEKRGISYISTCDDGRPVERTHFLILDMASERYRDLGDMARSYAYIQVDRRGRALHLASEARVAAYDPAADRLTMLKMMVGEERPRPGSFLYDNHPLQPGVSPDGRRLYLLPMSENALFVGDLTRGDDLLPLRRVAPVLPGAPEKGTDCRALDVDRRGQVWAVVRQTVEGYGMTHHLCVYQPQRDRWRDLGVLYVTNPDYVAFNDAAGKEKPWHHGFWTTPEGRLTPKHHHMAVKAARDGSVYVTVIAPFTLLRVSPEALRAAGAA